MRAAVCTRYGPPEVVRIVEAYRYLESGQKIGDVVIEVEAPRQALLSAPSWRASQAGLPT